MLKFLFGKKQNEEAISSEPVRAAAIAPGTSIRYDSNLVKELIADHGDLISLFTDIAAISGQRDSSLLTRQLAKFGSMLRGHILKENVRFYVYLKSSLQSDENSLSIMQEFSMEMQQIGRAVTDFLHKYSDVKKWDEAQWAVFERDLNAVGEVLTKRIQTEENTLYPLYMPPGSYA